MDSLIEGKTGPTEKPTRQIQKKTKVKTSVPATKAKDVKERMKTKTLLSANRFEPLQPLGDQSITELPF